MLSNIKDSADGLWEYELKKCFERIMTAVFTMRTVMYADLERNRKSIARKGAHAVGHGIAVMSPTTSKFERICQRASADEAANSL